MGTGEGPFKVRTVKRVTSKNIFDMSLLDSIKGSPWDLIGSQVPELSADRQLCPIPIDSFPRTDIAVDENAGVRDFKIFKKDLSKYGLLRDVWVVKPLETTPYKDRIIQHAANVWGKHF